MHPNPGDLLCSWNRIGAADLAARAFEAAGCPVVVTENAAWGNGFNGQRWYSMARNFHNTAGRFPVGSPERWDSLGVDLAPWRTGGRETVILPQRGIGPPEVAMPQGWPQAAQRKHGGRIRPHPGKSKAIPLETDLANASKVVTWGSGAAIKALLMGIPVVSEMPNWCATQDNTDAGRLACFRRLAWAQWTLDEIADGAPFEWLLGSTA